MNLKPITLLLFLFYIAFAANAQKNSEVEAIYVIVKMNDGSYILGRQLALTDEAIIIESESIGKLNLQRSEVRSFKVINQPNIIGGKYWATSASDTRNYLFPNAFGPSKGEGYYQNTSIFVHTVNVGINDHLSVSLSFEMISLLFSSFIDGGPSFILLPKYNIPVRENSWEVGVGGILLGIPDSGNAVDMVGIYGVNTFGNLNQNITIGFGFGSYEGDFSTRPVISLGGNLRIGEKTKLFTDNLLLAEAEGFLFSFGLEIIGSSVNWDLGVIGFGALDESGETGAAPLIGLTVPFGR